MLKRELSAVMPFHIVNVLSLAPLLQQALQNLSSHTTTSQDVITEFSQKTLRFLRSNYEVFVSAWCDRLLTKVLPAYNEPILTQLQLSLQPFTITSHLPSLLSLIY